MSSQASVLRFRPLTLEDLPLLHRWLNAEPVLHWYAKQPMALHQVYEKYAPRVSLAAPVKCFVALVDDRASGMFQFYRLLVFPDYATAVDAHPGWYATDFFLGEETARGRGLAPLLLRDFGALVFAASPDCTALVAGPHPSNDASIRTLQRAGYVFRREVEVSPGEFERLMVKERSVF